jgi:extradiol dioxygenase family protein
MTQGFHLSLPVHSVTESVKFFTHVLGASVRHVDASGYVNLDFFGTQITLAKGKPRNSDDFHFGVNLGMHEYELLLGRIGEHAADALLMPEKTVDEGTPRERRKLYVRCPSGYLIEIKGYSSPA